MYVLHSWSSGPYAGLIQPFFWLLMIFHSVPINRVKYWLIIYAIYRTSVYIDISYSTSNVHEGTDGIILSYQSPNFLALLVCALHFCAYVA